MKLLRELVEDVEYLTEENNGQKSFYIKGPFLQAGIANKNRRIYPVPVLEREVNRYMNESMGSRKNAFGELDHPTGPGSGSVSLNNVSHIIQELNRDGNNWIGKARLINEGMGKIAIGIIQAGGTLGVSSRGLGSLKEDRSGVHIVQDDYKLLVAADLVANPSAPDAVVSGIMESMDWVLNDAGELVQEKMENIRKQVHQTSSSTLNKTAVFENFIEAVLESHAVDTLTQMAHVDRDTALAAFKRAKVNAKLSGAAKDPSSIFRKAKEFLGVKAKGAHA